MPGVNPPFGDAEPDPDDQDGDENESSGAPPDPLDRLWFHPSELGALPSRSPAPAVGERRHSWGLVAVAAITGAMTAVGVVAAAGLLHQSDTSSTNLAGVVSGSNATATANALSRAGTSVVAVHAAGIDPNGAVVNASGIVIGERDVLTSLDAVSSAATLTVASRGRILAASVAGVDVATGLALLHIQAGQLVPARLGSSDAIQIGQTVVGLGATSGDHRWVDQGFVTARDRLAVTSQGTAMAGLIETNLRPVGGTAGGALLSASGDVVGIFVGPLTGSAMPMDWAQDIAAQLKESGKVHHAWLGAAVRDANDVAGGGARVVTTTPLGPAAVAGLVTGDVVVSVGNDRVTNAADLLTAVMQRRPGDPVVVKVRRLAVQLRQPVTLAERLATPVTDATGAVTG